MQRFSKTARRLLSVRRRAAASCLLALALALPAAAGADVALYEGAVQLKGLAEADRNTAFGDALRTAAVRASGRPDAASNPVIVAAAAKPAPYVQRYSIGADRELQVGFDGAAIEQLLQKAGLPLWPAERPTTLVLLYTPNVAGGSRAVLDSERPPERSAIETEALARGVPLAWPAQPIGLAEAQAHPPASDGGAAVLIGKGDGAAFAWTFSHAGQSARGQGAAADGVDLAADALAARYATAATRGSTTATITVGGINDFRAYADLLQYLDTLSLVRGVSVEGASGQTVRLELNLRGDLELLRRVAALEGHLQPGAAAAPGAATTAGSDFDWQP